MKSSLISSLLLAFLFGLLSACGQSGKLYLPEDEIIQQTTPEKPPVAMPPQGLFQPSAEPQKTIGKSNDISINTFHQNARPR